MPHQGLKVDWEVQVLGVCVSMCLGMGCRSLYALCLQKVKKVLGIVDEDGDFLSTSPALSFTCIFDI